MSEPTLLIEPKVVTRPTPVYFGPEDGPLFGWLHRPAGGVCRLRIVLCAPLGYEGLFAQPALRECASHLAEEVQAAVLRFDYGGTGDSAGDDDDLDRVETWLGGIGHAIDWIESAVPEGITVVGGLRMGANLAIEACARRGGADGLILWAPCARARAFVREQRSFALMAHATATSGDPSDGSRDDGFEANGYRFTSETVSALERLDLAPLGGAVPAPRMLILDRVELPLPDSTINEWVGHGIEVERRPWDGYASLMQPPLDVQIPLAPLMDAAAWSRALPLPEVPDAEVPVPPPSSPARVAKHAKEHAVWFGANDDMFGILTEPDNPTGTVLLLLNNAGGNRVGPHGMNPGLARSLATRGVATFRVDTAGIGDSMPGPDRPAHHPYSTDVTRDVVEAVDYLQRADFTEIAAGGLCSGAYQAWQAGIDDTRIGRLVLINQQTFAWKEGDSLDVSPIHIQYAMNHMRRSMRSGAKWLRLLKGQVAVMSAARLFRNQLMILVKSWRKRFLGSRRGSAALTQLAGLGSRGVRVHFIVADRDPAVQTLKEELGRDYARLMRDDGCATLDVIAGSDHSFTPTWATRALTRVILERLSDD